MRHEKEAKGFEDISHVKTEDTLQSYKLLLL